MVKKSPASEDTEETAGLKEKVSQGVAAFFRRHWFLVLLVVFGLGFGFGVYRCCTRMDSRKQPPAPAVVVPTPTEKPFYLTISHIEDVLAPASDLITTKYTYTDADVYENYKELFHIRLPITTNKVVFTYSGNVGIGIDLAKVSLRVDNNSKIITVLLPEVEIKYNEIDAESFEYYNVSTSIFNRLKIEDCTDLISTLLDEKEKQVLNDKSIMENARANTELVLSSLLSTSELTKEYTVIFK